MKDEAPRYKLAQDSYIEDRLYSAGMEYIDLQGKHCPGPHWEPVNDAAKAKAAEAKVVYTGEVPDTVNELVKRLSEAQAREAEKGDPAATGAAVVQALIAAGVITVKDAKAAHPATKPKGGAADEV